MKVQEMDISIIIVNYNVKYFLEQCLLSIQAAKDNLKIEVWVVDNNSVDGSIAMLTEKFKEVKIIANKENVGFSRANNQAMALANAKYQLILNPDTVLEKNTLTDCFYWMEEHIQTGGLGVKMIDGKGKFLPESKRGLPTPAAAFFKMTLLNKIFPKSKTFGSYHLGYLAENKVSDIQILSGAFMFIRSSVLDKIGFFDESFFMYGEDIDLSYRILKAGYKNTYYPKTTIIHYKGESTKKKTVNYVFTFYNAMIIFARKHYQGTYQSWMVLFLKTAIWSRASIAVLARLFDRLWAFMIDFVFLFLGFFLLAKYWEVYHKFVPAYYPKEYYLYHLSGYVLLLLCAVKLSGGYTFPYKIYRSQRGVIFGALLLLAIYGLLPKEWQFSRAIAVLGSLWALIGISLSRWVCFYFKTNSWDMDKNHIQKIAIVAENSEFERVSELMKIFGTHPNLIGHISIQENDAKTHLGNLSQLSEIIEIYNINELIFCTKDIDTQNVIAIMSNYSNHNIKFRIAPEGVEFIVGSHSKNSPGELFSIDVVLAINGDDNPFKKRLLDLLFGFIVILFIPILLLRPKIIFFKLKQVFQIIIGKKSFVGYFPKGNFGSLPAIKPSLLYPSQKINYQTDIQTINRVNFLYAKDYRPTYDIEIILKNIKTIIF